jgi:thymidylate synthase (FAD)
MKLIEPKVELLGQESGLEGIYKQIELAGRTCYKSEDKITDSSSVDFVKRMLESGHTAMLEHGTVYLRGKNALWPQIPVIAFERNPYSKTNYVKDEVYVTTNYRVLIENNLLGCMEFICEPTEFHERRITLKFTTSIGITRELIRHRVFSFANESTRYCNYSKDRFNNELTFIIPSWTKLPEGSYSRPEMDNGFMTDWLCDGKDLFTPVEQRQAINSNIDRFLLTLWMSEGVYVSMVNGEDNTESHSPQEVREILPLCTKSDIVMTGFVSDWKHFFDLRLLGTTGKPHPDMLLLAQKAKNVLVENNLWLLIYNQNERN